jgi:hypothetical protein
MTDIKTLQEEFVQKKRNEFNADFLYLEGDYTEWNKDCYWQIMDKFESSLKEAYTLGMMKGVELVEGVVPEKEIAQFGRENSWQMEHAGGFNKCRSEILSNITRLKQE